MALDITAIRLDKRQEKLIMKAAREKGRINLIMDGGKPRLSAKDQEKDTDVTVIDFGNHYYERLLTTLGGKGIVPSKELTKAIEKVLAEEKAYEDGEFFKAVGTIDGETEKAVANLRKKIDALLQTDLAPKMKNDYRAVLRKLDKNDCKPDYVDKWTDRVLGAEKVEAYENKLLSARDGFGDAALMHRLYGRIFIRGMEFKGGERLKWVRLLKPE
ncbi:MAG: hypothetical protein WBZ29_15375 [Methanocella sp.]